jgi:hypothetical protein
MSTLSLGIQKLKTQNQICNQSRRVWKDFGSLEFKQTIIICYGR